MWHGSEPIPGAREAVRKLVDGGKTVAFVTNASAGTRDDVVGKLKRLMGVDVARTSVYTSGYAAARTLVDRAWTRVYLIGEEGLRSELVEAGVEVVDGGPADSQTSALTAEEFEALPILPYTPATKVDAVVVGWDRAFNYAKACKASLYLQHHGARLVATNKDAFDAYPRKGNWPGAGTMVGAIEGAAPASAPTLVAGKPSSELIRRVLKDHGWDATRTLIVGDRLDTDVAMGLGSGVDTCLVLSGVVSSSGLEDRLALFREAAGTGDHPVHVCSSLAEVVGLPHHSHPHL